LKKRTKKLLFLIRHRRQISAQHADNGAFSEALVPEEFRAGGMSKGELRRTLGFEVLNEVEEFLKAHDLYDDYAIADWEREQQALDDPERAAGPGLNTELPQALP